MVVYILNILMEFVKNYDLDGIYYDDYFYFYFFYNEGKDFFDVL